jgi:osmoprotectant transport system substrate-binding protein
MRINRTLALGATVLALVLSACSSGGSSSPAEQKPTVTVGSAGFYEAQLMGEIYAQALENAGYTVERSLGLGTREATQPAIEEGQVNLLPEYIGSELTFLGGTASGDPEQTLSDLQSALADKSLVALDYTPAQDQNAFVVRQETADQYGLETMSDLAAVATELVWGLPPECETNDLCSGALSDAYGIPFDQLEIEPLAACDAPIATALNDGVVDVAELCSTQPAIEQFNFVVLTDDKQTQPSDNIVPIVTQDLLDAAPDDFETTLNDVSAKMTTEMLTQLGVEVAVQNRDAAEVAAEWLTEQGLI